MTGTRLVATIIRMFERNQYELVDFGDERKLERFGGILVSRPCPAATSPPTMSEWEADLRFVKTGQGSQGKWLHEQRQPKHWSITYESQQFELNITDSGQVGIFPEQCTNWSWISKRLAGRPNVKVLNLFAYTGASTLAAAKFGAEVTHVDAAKSAVNWARRNAESSGLGDRSIRWLVEDAAKFVAREIKRGNRYDGIILDPPSYGHGPKREEWKLTRDLFGLLGDCKQLLSETPVLFLLSCHTPGFGAAELSAALSTCLFGSCGAGVKTRDLALSTVDGRRLAAGYAAYWP